MAIKNFITNEKLCQRFDNSFTLVNYAIGIARSRIHKGQQQDKNMACEILEEIVDNHDLLEFHDEEEEIDEDEIVDEKSSIAKV